MRGGKGVALKATEEAEKFSFTGREGGENSIDSSFIISVREFSVVIFRRFNQVSDSAGRFIRREFIVSGDIERGDRLRDLVKFFEVF